VKIYVAAVEALRKKERQDETQFTIKIGSFLSLVIHRVRFKKNLHKTYFKSYLLKSHPDFGP
jgi:hypothetical protein